MQKILAVLVLSCLTLAARQRTSRPEVWAFTGPWDPASAASLRANAALLDVAITGWIGLDSSTAQPLLPSPFPDTIRLSKEMPRRMAIVTSWHGDKFHPNTIRRLARDEAKLARIAGAIAAHAAAQRYAGLVLDFEALERDDVRSLLRVVKAITDSAHARKISAVAVAIPATDTAAYPGRAIAGVADFVMPMLYDQHWSTSKPGPISEPSWVRSSLATRIKEVGAERIVAALPVYGYRWRTGAAAADPVSFTDARRAADQAGVTLARDTRTSTLRAVHAGEWEIWVTDAELFGTLVRQTTDAGVRRIAMWRIGQEDPASWRALTR